MAEASQYTFSLKEVGNTMLKKEGIKTGKWTIGVGLGIQVGNINTPQKKEARPSATVIVENIVLSRIEDETSLPPEMSALIIDATKLE
ncbi:hypothetical protein [Paralcaligenes ureilyticus]|uniref:Uncharacterized protein n=1 Tax=Paralcaligenes ureilyticus TaxID=627131 RepID=A0A4R3M7M7_9BURK|nr:hypothetical protein [Paralcaligenes ureilyticus]TCT09491.1 hypothetical protein EDC26_103109 [Paralcaligenes ureilyticus]